MRKIAAQESMLRNFTKKPNMVSSPRGSEEDVNKTKKNSKNSFNRGIMTPFGGSINQEEVDDIHDTSKVEIYRPKTPEIDEDILSGFDMRR